VLTHWLGLDWRMQVRDRGDVRIGMDGDRHDRGVLLPEGLFATADRDWLTRAGGHLPVLSWSPGALAPAALVTALAALVTTDPGSAHLRVDVLGRAFVLLAWYEGTRDRYGRFPAARSVAAQHGFLPTPRDLVHRHALGEDDVRGGVACQPDHVLEHLWRWWPSSQTG
jgi:hypothetical protein